MWRHIITYLTLSSTQWVPEKQTSEISTYELPSLKATLSLKTDQVEVDLSQQGLGCTDSWLSARNISRHTLGDFESTFIKPWDSETKKELRILVLSMEIRLSYGITKKAFQGPIWEAEVWSHSKVYSGGNLPLGFQCPISILPAMENQGQNQAMVQRSCAMSVLVQSSLSYYLPGLVYVPNSDAVSRLPPGTCV